MVDELILRPRTIDVHRNYALINQSIIIKPGSILGTAMPKGGSIMARVKVPQEFPTKFAIYDLKRFLAALAMFQKPKLTFLNTAHMEIRDEEATEFGLVVRYPLADPRCLDVMTEEPPNIEPDVIFKWTPELRDLFSDLVVNLKLPHFILSGDGEKVHLAATDQEDESNVRGRMPVGKTDKVFRKVWAAGDWMRLLWTSSEIGKDGKFFPASYRVGVMLRGLAQFVSEDEGKAQYWIASRFVSTWGGKQHENVFRGAGQAQS
jgi:hypothetical protein